MSRSVQIKDKFDYAEQQLQQLLNHMYEAKKAGIEAKHIVHKAAEILSTSRECYDYCARDVVEEFILQYTNNRKILSKHRAGELRVHFPFYANELTDSGNVFFELQYTNSGLYKHLIGLSENIAKNVQIPNTLFHYGDILQLKEMVNTKKHDRLIGVQSISNQEVIIESAGVKMVIPKKKQVGRIRFSVSTGSYVSNVAEFRFEFNSKEVGEFCLFTIESTKIVLDEIYRIFFNLPLK